MSRLLGANLKKNIFFFELSPFADFSNYLPLQIWTLKICIHDISNTITARSFKLCQLIERMMSISIELIRQCCVHMYQLLHTAGLGTNFLLLVNEPNGFPIELV